MLPTVGGIAVILVGVALTTAGVLTHISTLVAPGALLTTVGSAFLGIHFARTGVPLIPPAMKTESEGENR